jgi:hypothetical protein
VRDRRAVFFLYARGVVDGTIHGNKKNVYVWRRAKKKGMDHSWQTRFPPYTAANVETRGIIYFDDRATCYLEIDHPASVLMQCNSGYFGFDIQAFAVRDAKYFRVPKRVLRACCDIIRAHADD